MAQDSENDLVRIQTTKKDLGLTAEHAREKLSGARGPQYWRSLQELTEDPEFDAMMEREFPRHASEWTDPVSRRGFLKLMSASMALAGLSACTKQPFEPIVPYVQQPEELIPGKPIYFATARPTPNGAYPLLVRSHEFRPVKIEGNPDHPASKSIPQGSYPAELRWGVTDAQSQASVLDLYNPERSQNVTFRGDTRTWGTFVGAIRDAFGAERGRGGAGLRILTDTVTSPTLAAQIKSVLQANPQAKWYQWDAMNRDNARTGAKLAFGQYVDAQYRLAEADVVVSLDADFLSGSHFPGFLAMSRDFISKRKLDLAGGEGEAAKMNRLYVIESQASTTGGKADDRLPMRACDVEQFAGALANALGVGGSNGTVKDDHAKTFLNALVKDLQATRGRSVIIPGEQQSPTVHALAAAMNSTLGNAGKTVLYTEPVEIVPTEQAAGLKELVADMNAGKVTLLVMIGVNPVFDAPSDLKFADAFEKVALRAHVGIYHDETSRLSHWHVPMTHYLESWSDTRAYDGTVSIVQPLIEPLYNGRSAHEVVAVFSENPGVTAYDAVQSYWKAQNKGATFEPFWNRALHDGFMPNTASPARPASARPAASALAPVNDELEIVFRPDPTIHDGRYINNGWLQELSKPITKLTWDNAAIMSFNTAKQLGVKDEDVVTLELNGAKVDAPVLVVPGHPDKTITAHYGYGRTTVGSVGTGTGFNAFLLRTAERSNYAAGVKVTAKSGERWRLALTQHHHLIETKKWKEDVVGSSQVGNEAASRDLVRSATFEEWRRTPGFANEGEHQAPSRDLTLYGEDGYKSWVDDPAKNAAHQWGMAIDMNSCIGCNACVVACQSENNIPVVGKEQVLAGREMLWLRIDTYFTTPNTNDVSNPRAFFQPIPCMQCENAPCEPVCPVGATVHSPEGLNNMVYNRCVGTRYCSNNCPYKVRRFNFLLFADFDTESYKSRNNPDVTVRSRGVMEKCTYCVQRITSARIHAEKETRKVRDGEIVTACQQTCPTDAITFGDITDKNSRVTRMKSNERNYTLLAELNTRPRTSYVAEIRNPNPEIAVTPEDHGHTS